MPSNDLASSTVTASRGRIIAYQAGRVVFHVPDTNYELHLEADDSLASLVGQRVAGRVRVSARKVYGVPSGGNFVQPVLGTPRIIQGRVLSVESNTITVKAAAVFVVDLPTGPDTIDLHHGPIAEGSLVNVVALPGAKFELVR